MPKSIHTVNTNALDKSKVLHCSNVRLKSSCNVSRLFYD
jgi:hypothetical protein